jgi:hypothetical protein
MKLTQKRWIWLAGPLLVLCSASVPLSHAGARATAEQSVAGGCGEITDAELCDRVTGCKWEDGFCKTIR